MSKFSKLGSKRLVLLQIAAHTSLPLMFLYGSAQDWIISVVVYFFSGGGGMAVMGHRWMSHKSFTAPRWFQIFATLCGTLGGIGSPLAWVAIHRQHHRFVDKPGDPHSPIVEGIWKVQYKTMLARPNWRYVKDLVSDPMQRFFLKYHWSIQVAYVALLAAINPFAIVYAYLVPAVYLWNIGAALNIICHKFGYTNFKSNDHSRNNFLMALLMWGEGWHNNHHAQPSRWNNRHRWFEVDICAWVIFLVDPTKRFVFARKVYED
jgi:stearoyl-CoA desaturase (delta-9 desaturase)